MFDTPYEELEHLIEQLPDEGESIIVSRRCGELVCETVKETPSPPNEVVIDPVLYGYMVQANERLAYRFWKPFWVGLISWFASCSAFHLLMEVTWSGWYFDVGLALLFCGVASYWIQARQLRTFALDVQPQFFRLYRQLGLERHAVLGIIRHHPELRLLFRYLSRWD